MVVVGGDDGQVYFFDFEGVLKNKVSAHDGAVTGLVRVDGDAPFISGGFDGKLKMWSPKFELTGEVELCTSEAVLAGAAMGQDMKGVRGSVKALDCVGGRAVVGTKENEVYVVEVGSKEVR